MRALAAALALLLLSPSARAEEAEAPLVIDVEVRAPGGLQEAELRGLVAAEVGTRLSRRAVRRSVQRLYETGRFADVVARSIPYGAGVKLVFELVPKRHVARIVVDGDRHLGREALARATGLREGQEFTEDRRESVAAGVRAAYARLGYEEAQVRVATAELPSGLLVEVRIEEGPPTRLSALELEGELGDPALVRRTVTLRAGDVLDLGRLDVELDALRAAYRAAGHYRARVGTPRVRPVLPGVAEVRVPIDAGPVIDFAFRGNRLFDGAALRRIMAYEGQELLDPAMLRDLAARIERAYQLSGWIDARVIPLERRRGERLRVLFHVEEGRPLQVSAVRFQGNRALADEELLELLEQALLAARGAEPLLGPLARGELDAARGKAAPAAPRPLHPLRVYDGELYEQAREALLRRYREEGFLEAELAPPRVEVDEGRRVARVIFRVKEGERTRIAAVEFPGALRLDEAGFLEGAPDVAPGAPLDESALRERALELEALYASEGFLYARVEARVERGAAHPNAARVLFVVDEGPQVKVGRVLVQGARHTDPAVVEDAVLFREGGTLRSDDVAASQQRLMRLGIFRTAAIRPLDPDVAEPVKDIVVDLRERPRLSIEVGGGLSIADGPRAFAEATRRNLFGRNLELGARARVNYQAFREDIRERPFEDALERYVDVGLRYPHLYGVPIELGWRLDFIHERDIRPAYELTRWSTVSGFDWPVLRRLSLSLLGELESHDTARSPRYDDLYGGLSRRDLERLRFPEGETLLGSVRPALTLDLRDDPVAPRAGLLARTEVDFGKVLSGDTPDFVKVGGTITGYVPLASRSSLALSVGAGRIWAEGDSLGTLPAKRFFLGGSGSVRGFAEDGLVPEDRREVLREEIAACRALVYPSGCTPTARFLQAGRDVPSDGGNLYGVVRAELRFPIHGDLMGGLFGEAGNLWIDPRAFDALTLRPTAGAGLRYATPVGPVALDLGVNLDPDEQLNEDRLALHFSIGLF